MLPRSPLALQAMDGVSVVVVSLEEQQGKIQVVDSGPDREELFDVVVATGFQVVARLPRMMLIQKRVVAGEHSVKKAATGTSTFAMQGMTCANCAQTIEKGVAKVPGVMLSLR